MIPGHIFWKNSLTFKKNFKEGSELLTESPQGLRPAEGALRALLPRGPFGPVCLSPCAGCPQITDQNLSRQERWKFQN